MKKQRLMWPPIQSDFNTIASKQVMLVLFGAPVTNQTFGGGSSMVILVAGIE